MTRILKRSVLFITICVLGFALLLDFIVAIALALLPWALLLACGIWLGRLWMGAHA